jgi:hypothetical protein
VFSLEVFCQPFGRHSQGPAQRLTADLLLADDFCGGWYLSAELLPVWHNLRLLLISKLWAAYSTARLPPTAPSTAAQISARVMVDARAMIRRTGCWWTPTSGGTHMCSQTCFGGGSSALAVPPLSAAGAMVKFYAGLLLGIQLSLTFFGQSTIPFPCRTAHHRPAPALPGWPAGAFTWWPALG